MAVLTLFRHAKAVQAVPEQEDFDRALTDRGRDDAAWAGTVIAPFKPDLALVSASRRTTETWEIASQGLPKAPELFLERDLYLCSPAQLLKRIQAVTATVRSVVAVGHNPCMEEFALWLANGETEPEARMMHEKFPTSAIAVFDLRDGGWSRLGPESVAFRRFTTPRMGSE